MKDAYNKINYFLVRLTNEVMNLEKKALITEEFHDLTINDMHVLEAIGNEAGNNMSTIAKKRGITVGSLTTSINQLVLKGYVERNRDKKDRRIVNVMLTEKGCKAFKHHEAYHHQMTEAVMEKLEENELSVLFKTFDALEDFLRTNSEQAEA